MVIRPNGPHAAGIVKTAAFVPTAGFVVAGAPGRTTRVFRTIAGMRKRPPIQSGGTTTSAHNTTRLTTHRFIAPVILDHDHQRINLRKCNDPVTRVPLAITPKSPKRPPFLYRLSRGMPPTTTRLSDHAPIEPMAKVLPQCRALVLRIQRTAGELSVSEEPSRLFIKWLRLYSLTSLGGKLSNVDVATASAHAPVS